MVRLNRPPPKKIKTQIPKPKKRTKKNLSISVKPKSSKTNPSKRKVSKIKTESKNKKLLKKKHLLGTCYEKIGCKGKILKKCTKSKCKEIGGKSWKISDQCETV